MMEDTQVYDANEPGAVERAAALLQAGGLIAFPTDTVYGVGALAFDEAGIERLYQVKEREHTKAIAVLLSSMEELAQVAGEMGPAARHFARRFWPGPLTLVVPRHPALPPNISPFPTIGVRMPDHPIALALLRLTGPMAVTSANLAGEQSTRTAQDVYAQLAGRIPLILDGGQTPGGAPSTVVDCTRTEPAILREGPISLDDLRAVWSG